MMSRFHDTSFQIFREYQAKKNHENLDKGVSRKLKKGHSFHVLGNRKSTGVNKYGHDTFSSQNVSQLNEENIKHRDFHSVEAESFYGNPNSLQRANTLPTLRSSQNYLDDSMHEFKNEIHLLNNSSLKNQRKITSETGVNPSSDKCHLSDHDYDDVFSEDSGDSNQNITDFEENDISLNSSIKSDFSNKVHVIVENNNNALNFLTSKEDILLADSSSSSSTSLDNGQNKLNFLTENRSSSLEELLASLEDFKELPNQRKLLSDDKKGCAQVEEEDEEDALDMLETLSSSTLTQISSQSSLDMFELQENVTADNMLVVDSVQFQTEKAISLKNDSSEYATTMTVIGEKQLSSPSEKNVPNLSETLSRIAPPPLETKIDEEDSESESIEKVKEDENIVKIRQCLTSSENVDSAKSFDKHRCGLNVEKVLASCFDENSFSSSAAIDSDSHEILKNGHNLPSMGSTRVCNKNLKDVHENNVDNMTFFTQGAGSPSNSEGYPRSSDMSTSQNVQYCDASVEARLSLCENVVLGADHELDNKTDDSDVHSSLSNISDITLENEEKEDEENDNTVDINTIEEARENHKSPKKPTSFPEKFENIQNGHFVYDHSPEMFAIINSTSPVLLRRKHSNKVRDVDRARAHLQLFSNDSEYNRLSQDESKFVKAESAKTWHGMSRKKWKDVYAPVIKEMLQNANEDTDFDMDSNTMLNINNRSLLDTMHKKYCAYQYYNKLPSPVTGEATSTFPKTKLQVSPPPEDQMKSKSWLLQQYSIPGCLIKGQPLEKLSPNSLSPVSPITESRSMPNTPSVERGRHILVQRPTAPNKGMQKNNNDEEIEAVQACRWLKEAGFPQYAQMYEDGLFPVDILQVQREHDFLDKDSLQPLIRRLSTLNKCTNMRIGSSNKKESEESDDEDQCALSDRWKYQFNIGRWSRKANSPTDRNANTEGDMVQLGSRDSLLTDHNSSSETGESPVLDTKVDHKISAARDDYFGVTKSKLDNKTTMKSPKLRRATSEKLKGAKNLLKKMESFKSKKPKPFLQNGNVVNISGPVVTNSQDMQEKIKHLNCVSIKSIAQIDKNATECSKSDNNNDIMRFPNNVSENEHLNQVDVSSSEVSSSPTPMSIGSPSSSLASPVSSDSGKPVAQYKLSSVETPVSKVTPLPVDTPFNTNSDAKPECRLIDRRQSDSELRYSYSLNDLGRQRPAKFPTEFHATSTSLLNSGNVSANIGSKTPEVASDHHFMPASSSPQKIRRRVTTEPRKGKNRQSVYDNVPEQQDLKSAQKELDLILLKLFDDINDLNKTINGSDAALLEPPKSLDFADITGDLSYETDDSHDLTTPEGLERMLSSPDSSDHDVTGEESIPDDHISDEQAQLNQRRDSGVGASLTRTPSGRRRPRVRWHSFHKSLRESSGEVTVQICSLSVCQLMVLQKLSFVKLTGLMEKYSPNRSGWSWSVPRFMKRNKNPDYKDKIIFGIPLSLILQRIGQPLPHSILHAMNYLRSSCHDAVGIFRKPGVRTRILKIRNELEANPDANMNYEDFQPYDVADMVKQFFRDLPECLLTNKLSEVFMNIFIYLPSECRLEAVQATVLLLPDENREVLESLLLFLLDLSKSHTEHQMTVSNLAVCFAPSLFSMGGAINRSGSQSPSPRRTRKLPGVPDAREMMEQKAAHECLTLMIHECQKLFTISSTTLNKCRFSYIEQGNPVTMEEYAMRTTDDAPGYQGDIETCVQGLLKESHDKFRRWDSLSYNSNVEAWYKKVADGHPLRLWKFSVEVEAPPFDVLDRLRNDRQMWDEDLLQWRCVEKLDDHTEVFQYSRGSMPPHPTRDFVVLRSWNTDLPKGACSLISFSVEHPKAELLGNLRAVELASHFLIEPCGTGKSRITHITRVDLRGRTPSWYKKAFGYQTVSLLEKVKETFQQKTDGPESTV